MFIAALGAASAAEQPDLTGQVQSADGRPLQATVFISTAGPKVGTSPYCPSCYADCRKRATADAEGHFKIESLDPDLIFRILVVAKDYKPKYVGKVDPARGPVKVKLQPLSMAGAPPENSLRGRVLDSHGAPVIGAAVESHGMRDASGGKRWGGLSDIDPLAVTDDKGEFLITSSKQFAALDVIVTSRGFARKTFSDLSSGGAPHDLTLTEGASLKGRVVFNGKPLANVSMGIVSVDRGMENFTGNYDISTDADGRFEFVNLPANVRYDLYGSMKSIKSYGCIPVSEIGTGADGSTTDAGDLAVKPAHRLSGRVVLSDGAVLPAKTRLMIDRPNGWDSMLIPLDKDGHFDVGGIPAGETIGLSVDVDGYHPSIKNVSLDRLNPFGLEGRVDHDTTNLVLLMDRGPDLESHFDSQEDEADRPENNPLRGAEAAGDHSNEYKITGRVTDAKTGKPVAQFQVIPGKLREDFGDNEPNWDQFLAVDGTNGGYEIYFKKRASGQVALKVEAPGYMPAVSPPFSATRGNYDFTLTAGVGPSGTVLLPDGYPAAGVRVLLLCKWQPGERGLYMREGGKLDVEENTNLLSRTDADGHFTLPPQFDMQAVAVSGSAGFKMVTIESLRTNSQITLEAWGTIKGVLRRTNAPSRNEPLDLSFGGAAADLGLSLMTSATTDDKGAFEFDYVPPGDCVIEERKPFGDYGGWQSEELKQVRVNPGQTAEANIEAGARPAPSAITRLGFRNQEPLPVKYIMKGTVVLPDGKPAANAQVGYSMPRHFMLLGDGGLRGDQNNLAQTDAKGGFNLPIRDKVTALYAAHENGFARLPPESLSNNVKIILQSWGHVTGTLHVNDKPAANERISLSPTFPGQEFMSSIQGRTDDQGRFAFNHVPPGDGTLYRYVAFGNSRTTAYGLHFSVQAGETTNVVWGGNGRPVIGKCALDKPDNLLPGYFLAVQIHTKFPRPPGTGTNGYVSQRQWAEWRKSDAGRDAMRHFLFFPARVADDGSFHVDDVPPGTYELAFILESDQRNMHITRQIIATNSPSQIIVPPGPDSNKYEPFDLGTVNCKISAPDTAPPVALKPGDPAPALAARTLDDKPLQLKDYRGKYVLLDFSFQLPAANSDEIKAVHDSFAKDDRLIIINLCQDADDDYVKTLKDAHQWVLGTMDTGTMMQTWGVQNFPSAVLIDPEGKIAAASLRGEEIQSIVATALAKK